MFSPHVAAAVETKKTKTKIIFRTDQLYTRFSPRLFFSRRRPLSSLFFLPFLPVRVTLHPVECLKAGLIKKSKVDARERLFILLLFSFTRPYCSASPASRTSRRRSSRLSSSARPSPRSRLPAAKPTPALTTSRSSPPRIYPTRSTGATRAP